MTSFRTHIENVAVSKLDRCLVVFISHQNKMFTLSLHAMERLRQRFSFGNDSYDEIVEQLRYARNWQGKEDRVKSCVITCRGLEINCIADLRSQIVLTVKPTKQSNLIMEYRWARNFFN